MQVIEMQNVSKKYRLAEHPAVRQINLSISDGQKMGLIGANGSGKTTLMRLMLNFVKPDKGTVRVMGLSDLEKARQHIGFVPERQEGLENFTPRELLEIAARMHQLSAKETEKRLAELLDFAELREVADQLIADFSKGMSQRVQICLALLHQPKILLLDEPMSGLDPGGQKDVRDLLQKLTGITLVYASHQLGEIEMFCDTVTILHKGTIAQQVNLAEIDREIFTVELPPKARPLVEAFFGENIKLLELTPNVMKVQFTTNSDIFKKFAAALDKKNIEIRRLRSSSILEDLYYRYVLS